MFKLLQLMLFCLSSYVGYALSSSSCTNSSFCHQAFGNESYCSAYKTNSTGVCDCAEFYYLTNTNCEGCPGYGENCEVSGGCCNNGNLICIDKICTCFWAEYCWIVDDGERAQLQIAAQIVLAISLFLTASILFILFWNSCSRHASSSAQSQNRRVTQRNQLSLNSIQRLVFMQLQDRPPPYNSDLMSSCKHLNDSLDAPPSYTDAVQLPPLGEENLLYFLGEISPETQNNLEPPHGTTRNNQTQNEPMGLQSNTGAERHNELVYSEANLHTKETCSNTLISVFSSNSVNNNSLQSTEGTITNVSTTHHELHI